MSYGFKLKDIDFQNVNLLYKSTIKAIQKNKKKIFKKKNIKISFKVNVAKWVKNFIVNIEIGQNEYIQDCFTYSILGGQIWVCSHPRIQIKININISNSNQIILITQKPKFRTLLFEIILHEYVHLVDPAICLNFDNDKIEHQLRREEILANFTSIGHLVLNKAGKISRYKDLYDYVPENVKFILELYENIPKLKKKFMKYLYEISLENVQGKLNIDEI